MFSSDIMQALILIPQDIAEHARRKFIRSFNPKATKDFKSAFKV